MIDTINLEDVDLLDQVTSDKETIENNVVESIDDYEDAAELHDERIKSKTLRARATKKSDWVALKSLTGESRTGSQAEDRGFEFTYQAARAERGWLLDALMPFHEDNVISDVLRVVKGGKEATVYCCVAHPSTGVAHLAAKVYRPRMFRNLKNDAIYRVGTQMRDVGGAELRKEREQRAVAKRTKVGLQMLHTSWLSNELSVMTRLHKAGAIVPKPFANGENVVLMEYLGSPGQAAPPLGSVTLDRREAKRLFDLILENIKVMLANDVVHGDLSSYNILYWQGEARIIDFPQAVHPYKNPHAGTIFSRDVERVCDYFDQFITLPDPLDLARQIWREVMGLDLSEIKDIQKGRWNT